MTIQEIIVDLLIAFIPAAISYLIARHQGKVNIAKLTASNQAEIDKLMKQHEVNLDAIREQHRLEMEAKEKEQEYKLQLLQAEYQLKLTEQAQSKSADIITNSFGTLMSSIISNPQEAYNTVQSLKELSERLKESSTGD